ncbi:MAG: chromate transporter [Armatimonadetes bacterium]|nr:chromate transporter [Armatimonadota bacterium]
MRDLLLLAVTCLKAGTLAFGAGMGMIPMLYADVVVRYGWLSEREFLDGVALGHVTPGPVMVAATFVGWKVGGLVGAVVATLGIFAPSTVLTILVGWQLARVRDNPWLKGFLAGVQPAIVGLVAAVVIQLGRTALAAPATGAFKVDFFAAGLCLAALVLITKFKLDAALVILAGGVLGLVWYSM